MRIKKMYILHLFYYVQNQIYGIYKDMMHNMFIASK